jgi:hypothetical protein
VSSHPTIPATASPGTRGGIVPHEDWGRPPWNRWTFQHVREFLDSSFTDGFLILHRGRVVTEHYAIGMTAGTAHLSQSVAKSVVGTVAGMLAARGLLDLPSSKVTYSPAAGIWLTRQAICQLGRRMRSISRRVSCGWP